ncbi:MAG TPA: HTH domain-containing protein [Haliangium sp.]|nr:HTH domain-containing protein [Haliangium sp.]
MSTLAVVEEILRETQVPMSVRQIVEHAGSRLPTRSKTPDTVVARDLSMDIKRRGETSVFMRTSPGRYAIREIHLRQLAEQQAREQVEQQVEQQIAAQRHEASTPSALSLAAPATMPLPATESPPTSVLASAMKAERAAALPAKKPPATDEQTGTLH